MTEIVLNQKQINCIKPLIDQVLEGYVINNCEVASETFEVDLLGGKFFISICSGTYHGPRSTPSVLIEPKNISKEISFEKSQNLLIDYALGKKFDLEGKKVKTETETGATYLE